MSATHVMVDLETLGNRPGSVIVSIGAIAFDPFGGDLGEDFYQAVDPASGQTLGLTIDANTVLWWMSQSDAARGALTGQTGKHLATALQEFTAYWRSLGATHFWGHGANFDDPMLAAAYRAAGQAPPWRYSDSRCTRTLFDFAGVSPNRAIGTHHNALDDARAQAVAVIEAYRRLAHPEARSTGSAT